MKRDRLWNSKLVHIPVHQDIYAIIKSRKGKKQTYDQFWRELFKEVV